MQKDALDLWSEEHLAIRYTAGWLRKELDGGRLFASPERALELLGAFRTDLLAHFTAEERGPMRSFLTCSSEWHRRRVRTLLAQHAELAATLNALIEGYAGLTSEERTHTLRAFLDLLITHDEDEEELRIEEMETTSDVPLGGA